MNDVNRDPIRWERSMTQDKDGQYVAYHDYAVLLESHDALRAEVERLREFAREVNEADTEGYLIYVEEQDTAYLVSDPDKAIDDLTNHNAETMELIARPRRLEGV